MASPASCGTTWNSGIGSSRIHRVRSRSAEDRLMTSSLSEADEVTGMWRNEKWAVSSPPSAACAQLHC